MSQPDARILVVDDEVTNRLILQDLMGTAYSVHTVADGQLAIDYLMAGQRVDLILLDVMMPRMDGFEACRRIKSEPHLRHVPVLFLSGLDSAADEARGLSLGAEDFIHKPFLPAVVLARVRNHLELAQSRRNLHERNVVLETLVAERTKDLFQEKQHVIAVQGATITALCTLAEMRDNETGNHIRRTQSYVRTLAQRLRHHPRFKPELDDETIQLLYRSAPLHDVGKVAIPDAILLKPDKLTIDEWAVMRRHTEFGRDAIAQAESDLGASASFLRYAREIAWGHHEKWDGSGYPCGSAGEAIPLSARLMAAADVYDALISKRVYKPAFSHEHALAIIAAGRGTHFDPDIADALADAAEDFRDIAHSYRDE